MEKEKLVALVLAAQQGEEQAFTELFEAFHDDLYYHIFKTVNDQSLAEDLLQDAYMEIFQTIGQLNEPAAFVTWSKQIAYHRCTGYYKKRHEILADEDEDGHSVFDTIEEDRAEFIPDEALDKEELKQTLHGIIGALPMEQRSAVLLRYFDELSVKEIADIQGVSEGTVKSRLNYGRKAIKDGVEAYEKKTGVKLRCVGIIPLLLWLLREFAVANKLSTTSKGAAAAYAATFPAATATTTAAAGTAATTAAGGIAGGAAAAVAKGAIATGAKVLSGKLIAGIIAASLVVGGTGVGVTHLIKNKQPVETETTATAATTVATTEPTAPELTEPTNTVPETTTPSIKPVSEKKWFGFGSAYNLQTRCFSFTVDSISETHIRGQLLISTHNEIYHETAFSGEGVISDNILVYTIHFEKPASNGISTTKVYYYPDTDQFKFKDTLLYKATMNRVMEPGELYNRNVTFSGYGINAYHEAFVVNYDNHFFTLDIYEQRGIHISGKLTSVYKGKTEYVTEFTGSGFLEDNQIKYEITYGTPWSADFVLTQKGMWLIYDIEAQTFFSPSSEMLEFTVTKNAE